MNLHRLQSTADGTPGLLTLDKLTLHTIERQWLDNQPSISCIPTGWYTVYPHVSPKFGNCFRLVGGTVGPDSGHRTHILIHPANHAHELQGCIAPGLTTWGKGVGSSRKALEALQERIKAPTPLYIHW